MPSKGKQKAPGKCTNGPVKLNESNASTTVALSPELEQQFEAELYWCIQQLQTALKSGKLNNKQVQDHTKALNTLMSKTAPMVKKRQVMRLSFGNYREKMVAEEKKNSRHAVNMKVKPAVPSNKSVFVKKSTLTSSGSIFEFNFKPDSESLNQDMGRVTIKSSENSDFTYIPSDNTFRFSFNMNEEI